MVWNKDEANSRFIFECDTAECQSSINVPAADFGAAWKAVKERLWVSFKRTGRPWDYYCPKCAENAAADHAEWNRQERERERLKERNARYFE